MPPQAMRDAKWSIEQGTKVSLRERQAEWRARVEAFLATELAKEQGEQRQTSTTAKDKLKRLAAFDICCGVDHQLQIMTGEGFNRFKAQEEEAKELHKRPHLTLCWDTGSDNVACSSYLL